MKLIKLTNNKTERAPKTLRTLSAEECRDITGGAIALPSFLNKANQAYQAKPDAIEAPLFDSGLVVRG